MLQFVDMIDQNEEKIVAEMKTHDLHVKGIDWEELKHAVRLNRVHMQYDHLREVEVTDINEVRSSLQQPVEKKRMISGQMLLAEYRHRFLMEVNAALRHNLEEGLMSSSAYLLLN